jgi:purine-binding chemotaxis protein CheW
MNMLACMDIKYVIKVLPLMRLEPVPLGPIYTAGMMNLAGKSIPVLDLAMMLNLPRTESYTMNMPVLLCANGAEEIGVIVDAVSGLALASETEIQVNDEFKHASSPFSGTINFDSRLSFLLNMQNLFKGVGASE